MGQKLEDYMVTTNRIIKELKTRYRVLDLEALALKGHFAWAGHVSRLIFPTVPGLQVRF